MRVKREFAAEVVTDPAEALRRIVYGAEKLDAASKLVGVSHQTLSKQLHQEGDNGVWISRAASIEAFFDSDQLAECFAARRGGIFLKLPEVPAGSDAGLVVGYSKLIGEFAEASRAFSEALADQRITLAEVRKFHKELRDVTVAGEHLVRAALAKAEKP